MVSGLEPGRTVPTILRLRIDRFRGLKMVDWRPRAGLNLILGGGDVGKTRILDAVALLLSPVNPANLPDTDFYGRAIEERFSIEAVLSLPATIGIHGQLNHVFDTAGDLADLGDKALQGAHERADELSLGVAFCLSDV
ncbi:MAG: hypothetical protein NVS3B5_04080 [Sphingomicrobium sp.]